MKRAPVQRPGISSDAVDRMHAHFPDCINGLECICGRDRSPKREAENEELRYRDSIYLTEDEVNDEDLVRYYRNGVG
jgi:hypothetical protein